MVTPEKVLARWEGAAQSFSLPAMEMQQQAQNSVLQLRNHQNHRDDPDVQRLWPTFDARGGIGLYVDRGSASFRAVTLTPLVGAR